MRTRLAGLVAAALFALTACGSGLPDQAVRTGPLPATPTPLPTPTPLESAGTDDADGAGGEEDADTEPEATATPEPTATAEPTATPEPPLDEAVEDAIASFLDESGAPGAVVAVRLPDGTEMTLAGGVADLVAGTPLEVDDYFWIGSITKPVTAAVVLQLAEEGLVDLDAPVETYVPGWAAGYEGGESVTVRQLLNHTNGFIEYAFDPGFFAFAAPRLAEEMQPEEIIAFAVERGPQYEIGTQYSYNTTGFLAAGLVIEAVTGNDAATEIRARIFEPLGMADAYLPPTENPPEAIVRGYSYGELAAAQIAIGGADVPPEAVLEVDGETLFDNAAVPQTLFDWVGWTGGGIRAQADDVNQFMEGLADGTLLGPESFAEMTEPTLGENYGLGLGLSSFGDEPAIGHGGGVPGFRSDTIYLLESDVAVTVLTNGIVYEPDVGALTDAVVELVLARL